jgi:hypothetical protein
MVQTFHPMEANDFSSGGLRQSTCGEKLKGVKMTKGRILSLIIIAMAFAVALGMHLPPIRGY